MAMRSCPQCAKRLPYAGRRCIHCGWKLQDGTPEHAVAARRRRAAITSAVALVVALLVGSYAYQNAGRIADWYAAFAAQHLPAGASSLAPAATESGAFFFCVRQVVRRIPGELSVATFPTLQESQTASLGESRYRIESFVDEDRLDGEQVRHDFSCTARFDRSRWVLEELKLEQYAHRE